MTPQQIRSGFTAQVIDGDKLLHLGASEEQPAQEESKCLKSIQRPNVNFTVKLIFDCIYFACPTLQINKGC